MNKLLNASFKRLITNKLFLGSLAFMFIAGLYMPVPQYLQSLKSELSVTELDRVFFSYVLFISVISSVICSVFIGTEYSDNTMHNKVSVGHKRTDIYISNLITCVLASLAMFLTFVIPCLCVGIPLLGFFLKNVTVIILTVITSFLLILAYNAIFCLIAMLCRSKTTGAIICIFAVLLMIIFGSYLNSSLEQPKTTAPYVLTADGVKQEAAQPNPYYIGGVQRQIFIFLLNFTPGGQTVQILSGGAESFLIMSAYSAFIFIFATGAGLYFFRKKDLN